MEHKMYPIECKSMPDDNAIRSMGEDDAGKFVHTFTLTP